MGNRERWTPTGEQLRQGARFLAHQAGQILTFRAFTSEEAPDHMSEHYRGGAAMLDRELFDQVPDIGWPPTQEELHEAVPR